MARRLGGPAAERSRRGSLGRSASRLAPPPGSVDDAPPVRSHGGGGVSPTSSVDGAPPPRSHGGSGVSPTSSVDGAPPPQSHGGGGVSSTLRGARGQTARTRSTAPPRSSTLKAMCRSPGRFAAGAGSPAKAEGESSAPTGRHRCGPAQRSFQPAPVAAYSSTRAFISAFRSLVGSSRSYGSLMKPFPAS